MARKYKYKTTASARGIIDAFLTVQPGIYHKSRHILNWLYILSWVNVCFHDWKALGVWIVNFADDAFVCPKSLYKFRSPIFLLCIRHRLNFICLIAYEKENFTDTWHIPVNFYIAAQSVITHDNYEINGRNLNVNAMTR